jgi:hypothetical protein
MNLKTIMALIGVMLFGAGIVMAIAGAGVEQEGTQTRWTQPANTTNIVTEGGNITAANITGTTLTDRWAAFFGNVSGTVVLRDSADTVFSWSWTAANGGEVCLSTGSTFAFTQAVAAGSTDVDAVDTAFGLGVAADNASKTLTNTTCDLKFNNIADIDNTAGATTGGGFETCLVKNTAATLEGDFAFCTNINSTGKNYKNAGANYQVMVPTSHGATDTETYYFYMELD